MTPAPQKNSIFVLPGINGMKGINILNLLYISY